MVSQPKVRSECPPPSEPCPHVTCRYHLWTTRAYRDGAIVAIRESETWGDTDHTCALHEADAGWQTAERVAATMHISRQRVNQIEAKALRKMRVAIEQAIGNHTDSGLSWESNGTDSPSWSARASTLEWADAMRQEVAHRLAAATTVSQRSYAHRMRRVIEACEGMPAFVCHRCGRESPPLTIHMARRVECAHADCRFGRLTRADPPPRRVLSGGVGVKGTAGNSPGFVCPDGAANLVPNKKRGVTCARARD